MQLTTPVETVKNGLKIGHKSKIMLLGSCFAQNIGQKLQECKFNVCSNPFGIVYNPLSISTILQRIVSGKAFDANSPEIFEHAEMWHSILHHSDFSRKTKEDFLANTNNSLAAAHNLIKESDVIIITFGTAYAYERASDGLVVSNCHKLPAKTFNRRLLRPEEIVEQMSKAINGIIALRPEVKFIFTVSPIRHLRDGAHDNQLSKATLLIATEELRRHFPNRCDYFPSYEIMMDELRDYRFYADDMTHPSTLAIEYIWERFATQHITEESLTLNHSIEDITRGLAHRPFDPESKGYKKFVGDIMQKIAQIKGKHPYLDFEKEEEKCNTLLNK